jgi:CrcB protein
VAERGDHAEVPLDPDLAPRGLRSTPVEPSVLGAIALGGALGAPARYGVAQIIHGSANGFPWATFAVNVSGSLALGLILVLLVRRFPANRHLRPFLATGFLGAYTTFSAFAVETDLLIKNGHAGVAVTYAGTSLIAGLVAVWIGMQLARALPLSETR